MLALGAHILQYFRISLVQFCMCKAPYCGIISVLTHILVYLCLFAHPSVCLFVCVLIVSTWEPMMKGDTKFARIPCTIECFYSHTYVSIGLASSNLRVFSNWSHFRFVSINLQETDFFWEVFASGRSAKIWVHYLVHLFKIYSHPMNQKKRLSCQLLRHASHRLFYFVEKKM